MLVFSTSDKGGSGRSVTSSNIAYRLCLQGYDVAYADFDFGSPTAGALFEITAVQRGLPDNEDDSEVGLHRYLLGSYVGVARFDVGATTDRSGLRYIGSNAGRLVLLPGDEGGAEFLTSDDVVVNRCARLLTELDQEFEIVVIDLSAGRSVALEIALKTMALEQLRDHVVRWLVFHRWTRQHILAAAGLVYGPNGLVNTGVNYGHRREELLAAIRFVRTAVPAPNAHLGARHGAQATWLQEQNAALKRLATHNKLGLTSLLGATPIEQVLQWREQIILDNDVVANIAAQETVDAYNYLARRLMDNVAWERL
ncbi:SCO2523 family variant P-loop protein [Nocardia aurea]|uniref:SCO2523 family variant P-loop protein n=1 Tax=Nocardia aurea TaxID=2144174 RepID=A0ABV3FU42_9NOCA